MAAATIESHLYDLAVAKASAGMHGNLSSFIDEALSYLDALGLPSDRETLRTTIETSRRLRKCTFLAKPSESSDAAVAAAATTDVEAAAETVPPPPPTDVVVETLEETLLRLVTALRERVLSERFLEESNAVQNEYFVHIDLVYRRTFHEPLMAALRAMYTVAEAETKALRPVFMSPFIKNVEQCRHASDRDVCTTLFFRFIGDPRPFIRARRAAAAATLAAP